MPGVPSSESSCLTTAPLPILPQGSTFETGRFGVRRWSVRIALAAAMSSLAVLTGCMLGLVPGANIITGTITQTHMYITFPDENRVKIFRLDGTHAADLGDLGGTIDGPEGIAIDNLHWNIYVTNKGDNTITVANFDGTNPRNLGNPGGYLDGPVGIALDLTHNRMYILCDDFGGNRVVSADLDGENATNLGTPGGGQLTRGIAVDPETEKLYLTELPNTVVRVDTDGANAVDLPSPIGEAMALALDTARGHMYVSGGFGLGGVRRANLDGTSSTHVLTSHMPFGIALDLETDHVHVVGRYHDYARARLSGSGVVRVSLSGTHGGIALGPYPIE